MKFNVRKYYSQDPVRCKIIVDNECLKDVKNFKYLRCKNSYEYVKNTQKQTKNVSKIGISKQHFRTKSGPEISRIKEYNALALSILFYGSKIRTLRKRDKSDGHQSRLKFSEGRPDTPFLTIKEMKTFWKN